MATKIIGDLADTGSEAGFSTVEYAAVRKVMSEHLKNATKSNTRTEAIIREHASNMRKLLGSYDYEAINLPIIMKNGAEMDIPEFRQYLKTIEALSLAYMHLFGRDIAFLLVSGMLAKFRNSNSLSSHYSRLVEELEGRIMYYKGRTNAEMRIMSGINCGIKEMENGIFRFFRKKKIASARARMSRREEKIKAFDSKAKKFADVLENMNSIVAEEADTL